MALPVLPVAPALQTRAHKISRHIPSDTPFLYCPGAQWVFIYIVAILFHSIPCYCCSSAVTKSPWPHLQHALDKTDGELDFMRSRNVYVCEYCVEIIVLYCRQYLYQTNHLCVFTVVW